MKKILSAVLVVGVLLGLCSCKKTDRVPSEEQIKAICELSALDCYYNNVAKIEKSGGLLKKARKLWIEYEGVAKIGVDINQATMTVKNEEVTITLPPVRVLSIGIVEKTLNKDSYILSQDGLIIKNRITVDEQRDAIDRAQKEMEENVKLNKSLFSRAESESKKLIENYINKIGDMSGKEYTIKWK